MGLFTADCTVFFNHSAAFYTAHLTFYERYSIDFIFDLPMQNITVLWIK